MKKRRLYYFTSAIASAITLFMAPAAIASEAPNSSKRPPLLFSFAKELSQENQPAVDIKTATPLIGNKLTHNTTQSLQLAQGLTDTPFSHLPEIQELKKNFDRAAAINALSQKKAETKLAGLENDPCYDVLWTKAMSGGIDMSHLVCIPLMTTITWKVHASLPTLKEQYDYVVQEVFPEYAEIYYDFKTPRRLWAFHIRRPSRLKDSQVRSKLLSARALWAYGPGGGVVTTNISDFKVENPGYFGFRYDSMPRGVAKSGMDMSPIYQLLEMTLPYVGASSVYRGAEYTGYVPDLPYGIEGTASFTLAEINDAIKNGHLTKEFTLPDTHSPGREIMPVSGSVLVDIQFGKSGMLNVSPKGGLFATGPDKKGEFTPSSQNYVLKNTGRSPIQYKAAGNKIWISLSRDHGALTPGASSTVEVRINKNAIKLKEGIYKDIVSFTNTTNGTGNTARPVELTVGEEQRWLVFLTGYEIDEMNQFWKTTTKIRGAIRFDYTLRGEFVIKKKKGKWVYKNGAITLAKVGISDLHQPLNVWQIKPLKCKNCSQVSALKGKSLSGEVSKDTIRLYWGKVVPTLHVEAKLKVSCIPMPRCAKWGGREFGSERFFDDVNSVVLPLKHEAKKSGKVADPQGLRWVNYNYTLRRLK